MRKTTLYSLLAIFSLFLVVFSVSAKNENGVNSQQIEQEHGIKATDSGQRQTPNPERCSKLTARIDERINKYNSGADHPRLLKFQTRLGEIITKLKAKGYDTSKLEADLSTLKTKTDACRAAYGQFITKLGVTKNFVCGQSQGQFRAALQASKTQMESAQTACKDARSFMDTVTRPDLKALREKVKADRQLSPKPTKEPSPSTSPSL